MQVSVQALSTVVFVDKVPPAREFLAGALGFEVVMDVGWFASLKHPNGALFDLWQNDHPKVPSGLAAPPAGFVIALVVEDLAAAQAAFVEGGGEITHPAVDEPWGQRHFFGEAPGGIVFDVLTQIPPDPEWMKAHGFG